METRRCSLPLTYPSFAGAPSSPAEAGEDAGRLHPLSKITPMVNRKQPEGRNSEVRTTQKPFLAAS